MARATARDLVESSPAISLLLADLNPAAAREVGDGLRKARPDAAGGVSERSVDASDARSVREVVRGADVVINSALYYFNLPVMQAALAERVPYVDLGGLFHVTRQQQLLHAEFERAGLTAWARRPGSRTCRPATRRGCSPVSSGSRCTAATRRMPNRPRPGATASTRSSTRRRSRRWSSATGSFASSSRSPSRRRSPSSTRSARRKSTTRSTPRSPRCRSRSRIAACASASSRSTISAPDRLFAELERRGMHTTVTMSDG
jgi:Saccharopine dehydrogenase NADP binding domain